jgi:hypothetical protein
MSWERLRSKMASAMGHIPAKPQIGFHSTQKHPMPYEELVDFTSEYIQNLGAC